MKITLYIPDDLAERLGAPNLLERELLESLALQGFKRGDLTRLEICRLLGFDSDQTDLFLAQHGAITGVDNIAGSRARQAIENIIARRRGITLGGVMIKDLINEGRP